MIDGRNRRVGKKIDGGLIQAFLYDDQLRIAAELDGSGNVVSRFVYGTHVNVPELMIQGSTTYRILTDHLGSPRLVVNTADASIAQRMDYDEFGVVILDSNPGFQPFGFAGGLYDTQTKFVRFGLRDYDAQTGALRTKDLVGLAGDLNLYVYSGGEPVDFIDPLGLSCESATGEFATGPWGRRPNSCLCDRERVFERAVRWSKYVSGFDRGEVPAGRPGPSESSGYSPGIDGLYHPYKPPVFSPSMQFGDADPCIRFCQRMHEWVHYTDMRPVAPEILFDDTARALFKEPRAFRKELACLQSFL